MGSGTGSGYDTEDEPKYLVLVFSRLNCQNFPRLWQSGRAPASRADAVTIKTLCCQVVNVNYSSTTVGATGLNRSVKTSRGITNRETK